MFLYLNQSLGTLNFSLVVFLYPNKGLDYHSLIDYPTGCA